MRLIACRHRWHTVPVVAWCCAARVGVVATVQVGLLHFVISIAGVVGVIAGGFENYSTSRVDVVRVVSTGGW
jgi:hypothetical protein